jgi:sensor histidine kinase regulating citrate/malate metabolism
MAGTKNNNTTLNKVFASPYKDEIEKRLAVGQSPRSIANWLKSRGEDISHTTINTYKAEYFDTKKVMKEIIQHKQEETAKDVEVIVEPVSILTADPVNQQIAQIRAVNHIALLYENIQDMRQYLSKLQNYEPVVAAHAAKGIYQEIRATIETLEKIQAGTKEDDNSSVAKLLTKLKAQKREMDNNVKQQREGSTSEGDSE